MKIIHLLLTLAAAFGGITVYPQAVVSLHKNGAVQHFLGANALINAYQASATGDTIYLPGGAFAPPPNFDKGLTIYGAGHYIDSTQATGKSFINGTVTVKENADNFHLEGVEITENMIFTNNESSNQVTIKYCKINATLDISGNLSNPSNNLALIECVFLGDVNLTNATNVGMYNCIVQSHLSNSVGNLVYNSVFLFGGSFNNPVLNGQFVNNNMYNNIFIQTEWNAITSGAGNNFKNNVFVLSAPELGTAAVEQGNYFGISKLSIFTNQTGNSFNYVHNYHLQSPATYPGTDGAQIGIFGGIYPYKESAVPSNPHIRVKTVSPTTDAQGKLNVNIHVAAQNN